MNNAPQPTPADELRTAADKIRKLVAAIPNEDWGDRPWHAEECSDTELDSCPCIVAQGERREFDQPQDPPIQYVADAEDPDFAAYIAAMGPPVARSLAAIFDAWARIGDLDPDLLHRVGGPETLAAARALNAA
ncbi:hypothetical protein [Streptomyces europaeiscabiei]|uniref:hypothetical protein n=1 Tax=Streptomyces europaeiscabiei TaxID=146819 RepID=UPI0029AA1419|nr:hypothetical protein [Streptomyces europaeiscabiei]MDX2766979.1 hypothetical protein [Streptomyces europaeiscabiei]